MATPGGIATFRNAVQVDGVLSGQTITRIDTEKTAVQNSLNSHISTYLASEAANLTSRNNLATGLTDLETKQSSDFDTLDAKIDDSIATVDAALTTEITNRLNLEQNFNNRSIFVDGEIQALNDLHTSDSNRLTTVESRLDSVDVDLKSQIDSAVNQLNINHANVEPRTAKLEEYFIIDEASDPANPVVRIKPGVKFEVSGEFVQG